MFTKSWKQHSYMYGTSPQMDTQFALRGVLWLLAIERFYAYSPGSLYWHWKSHGASEVVLNPLSVGPVYIRDPHLVITITVPADALAPTVLGHQQTQRWLHSYTCSLCNFFEKRWFWAASLDRMTSFKMVDGILKNLTALVGLNRSQESTDNWYNHSKT